MLHPNELDKQINNLRTLQQSYDQIAEAAEAYNVGKTQLAAAITAKGVETSPTETYPEMAEKVNVISQETYEINGGEMYAKQLFGSLTTPNYWNLYEILMQLLSDGRLVNYGGILLAEYYRGYDSLALSGAGAGGAYVVSDKDANGDFILYTSDTTHTWDTNFDGKGNRWVAYCFAEECHDFQITDTNTSPRSIFIGRKVGNITLLANARTAEIVVPDGNVLRRFTRNSYSCGFNNRIVLRNVQNISASLLNLHGANQESIYIECDEMNSGVLAGGSGSINNRMVSIIIKAKDIPLGAIIGQEGYGGTMNALAYLELLHTSKNRASFGSALWLGNQENTGSMPILKQMFITSENISLFIKSAFAALQTLFLNYIDNDSAYNVTVNGTPSTLTDIVLKDGWCKPLVVNTCTNLIESNMYAHILQRLKQDEPDCGDGVTITLGATNLAKLTGQESIDLLDLLTNTYGYTFA